MDDFCFPAVQMDHDSACNLPFPHFAASPLWYLSSVSDEKATYRRSFSSAEEAVKVADTLSSLALNDDEGARKQLVSEEKMDMLWEDFNDELYQVSYDWKKKDSKGKSGSVARGSDQAFGMPRDSRSLLPRRRPSLVVMLKLLKKMFLIQKNGSSKRASIYKI